MCQSERSFLRCGLRSVVICSHNTRQFFNPKSFCFLHLAQNDLVRCFCLFNGLRVLDKRQQIFYAELLQELVIPLVYELFVVINDSGKGKAMYAN